MAAAAPVLAAAIRISSERGRPPDLERLRRGMAEAVRDFEKQALATGLDTRSLRAARYALCATIDDLVLSTPWGSTSTWAAQSLTSIFHNEVTGGERFFDILQQMEKDLGRHSEVVELMYLCASLGFEGRYRVMPRGIAALSELRESVYRTIRQRRGDFERELSPHWKGLQTGYTPLLQRVPLWMLGVATLGAACLIYVLFNFSLAGVVRYRLQRSQPIAAARRDRRAAHRGCSRRRRRHRAVAGDRLPRQVRPRRACTSSLHPKSRRASSRCWRIRNRLRYG